MASAASRNRAFGGLSRPGRGRLLALVPLALAAGLGACGGSKVKDCEALMGLVNTGLEQLENGRQQQKNDPTKTVELRKMADQVEKTSTDAAALSIATPEVKTFSTRYASMTKDIAKNAREVADAHEKNDLSRLEKARAALNETLKLEDPLVDEINKFCGR